VSIPDGQSQFSVKSLLRVRQDEKIERFGEEYLLDGRALKGIFRDLAPDQMRIYLSDPALARIARSGVFMVTFADAPIKDGDSIVRGSVCYRVLKATVQRVGGCEMAKNVVLARESRI
jgi:hypothetical protein